MPDWSYAPLLQPLLFRLPPRTARDATLGALGRLADSPLGPQLIDFLGHMQAPEEIRVHAMGLDFASPVGLGAGLDPEARALHALARFGLGFVEAGPVTTQPVSPSAAVQPVAPPESGGEGAGGGSGSIRRVAGDGIVYHEPLENPGADALAQRLASVRGRLEARLGVRVAAHAGSSPKDAAEQLRVLIERFAPLADYLVVSLPEGAAGDPTPLDQESWAKLVDAASRNGRPLLACVPPGTDAVGLEHLAGPAVAAGVVGLVVAGGLPRSARQRSTPAAVRPGAGRARLVGAATREASLATIRTASAFGAGRLTIIGSGGVVAPQDALAALDAGADLVQLHTGLVVGGPGLPKRINEALLFRHRATAGTRHVVQAGRPLWLGHLALGAGMIVAGCAAIVVAATAVLLPYELGFLGVSREALAAYNARLLDFLRHDRISLAGTMISIGVMYSGLAWYGVRRRVHWAAAAIALSAGTGFVSFFLFLIYGYFDPLHAGLAVGLLACFLVGLCWRADDPPDVPEPDLANDGPWRRAMVGQAAFVVMALGLIGGGAVIAAVGSTTVFVPEDLDFMRTTAANLAAANSRLLPLVAHDRAGFGGALVADGLAALTLTLWGVRRGARWVWWTLLAAGAPGLVAALGVHLAVGYLDFGHLAPVVLALGLYLAGLALTRDYLGG